MSKIATEQEAYNIGGKGTPVANKCVTNARAYVLGCKKLSVADNKLVEVSALSKNIINLGPIRFYGSYTADAGATEIKTGTIELLSTDAPEDLEFVVGMPHTAIVVVVSKGKRIGRNSEFNKNYYGPTYNEQANAAYFKTPGYTGMFQK